MKEQSEASEKESLPQERQVSEENKMKQQKLIEIFQEKKNKNMANEDQLNNLESMEEEKKEDMGADDAVFSPHSKQVIVRCLQQVQYTKKACLCCKSHLRLRRAVVWLIEWKQVLSVTIRWFDRLIIFLIFLNSIFMAVYDYSDRDNLTFRNNIVEKSGLVFSGLFTAECVLKIIGMGFICHKNAYLRDPWNWIDFVVVIIGIVEILPNIPNMKALRTLRVLRPLRSIKSIPSMRKLISSLLKSLPALANVVIFLMFVFILFGILGVQQYTGAFYNRCRMTPEPVDGKWEIDREITRLCSKDGSGLYTCPQDRWCGHPQDYPDILNLENEEVINQETIFYGIVTFDNILIGMITIFQIITLEGWAPMMYLLMDNSQPEFGAIFFTLMVLIGSFFMLQLILAVIMGTFDTMEKEEAEEHNQQELERIEMENQKNTEGDKQITTENNQVLDGEIDERFQSPHPPKSSEPAAVPSPMQINQSIDHTHYASNQQQIEIEQRELGIVSVEEHTPKNHTQSRLNFAAPIDEIQSPKVPDEFAEQAEQESMIARTLDDETQDDVLARAKKNRFIYFFYKISTANWFTIFVVFLILGNTVTLALDRHPIEKNEYKAMELANEIFSWLFFAEMVIKMLGLGLKGYSRDRFNLFDCLIVVVSTVEIFIAMASPEEDSAGGAISAFRGVRLLRVFKLARSWKSFQEILVKIGNSLKDISNFSVLLFLFIFIYSLLGMELFAYRIKFNEDDLVDPNGESTRTNFDEFINSVTTIFIVLIGEDWNNIMYQYVRGTGTDLTILFFVSLMILGNLVLLNLFLAILLKNFSEDVNVDEEEIQNPKVSAIAKFKTKMTSFFSKNKKSDSIAVQDMSFEKTLQNDQIEASGNVESINSAKIDSTDRQMLHKNSMSQLREEYSAPGDNGSLSNVQQQFKDQFGDLSKSEKIDKKKNRVNFLAKKKTARQGTLSEAKLEGRSLFIMGPNNCLRQGIKSIVSYRYFDPFILFMICASTILLTLENPLDDPNGTLANVLHKIDIGVTTIFTLEMVLKIAVLGFLFCGSSSYLRNTWNILDFIIVVFSIVSLAATGIDLKFIKVLRILRVLRPLRMISRNEGLKVAVTSLINAGPGILNVMVISVMFFLLFGILGVTYFKGEFFYCHTDNLPEDLEIITSFDCVNQGGEWVNMDSNFDSIMNSMITLFEMSSTEGWIDVMWNGVDSVDIGYQPIKNYSFGWVFFFIGFIIIGSLFVLNLFVGVVIDTFNREKEKLGRNFILTETQREWIQIQIICFKSKPVKKVVLTGNRFRDLNIRIANHPLFDGFIIFCIILNTVVLALKWYDEPGELPGILEIINYGFAGIFTLEAIIKLFALRCAYFKDGWNIFDFIIVIGTFGGIIMTELTGASVGSQTTLIRAFRIGRIFRLIKRAKQLRVIFNTFVVTIPSLANVGSLLILLLYIYSILGVFLFANVKLQSDLDVHANFQSFGRAFLTLIRASTGEAWNSIMNDCKRQRSVLFDCVDDPDYEEIQKNGGVPNGCGTDFAIVFFVSFLLIVTFVFLNLFIAIILEGFANTNEAENLRIPESVIDEFKHYWSEYDPNANGYINCHQLNHLIQKLAEKKSPILVFFASLIHRPSSIDRFIAQLRIPCYKNFTQYHYLDVLNALCKHNFSIKFQKEKIVKLRLLKDLEAKGRTNEFKPKDKEEIMAESFDHVIEIIEKKFEQNKISVVESFRKIAFNHHKKTARQLTQFGDTVFDSSHIVLVPFLQQMAKQYIQRVREGRKKDQEATTTEKKQDTEQTKLQKQKSLLKKGTSTDVDTAVGSNEDVRIKDTTPLNVKKDGYEPMNKIMEETESVYSRQNSQDVDSRALSKFGKVVLNNNNEFNALSPGTGANEDSYQKTHFSPRTQAVSKSQQMQNMHSRINERPNEENQDLSKNDDQAEPYALGGVGKRIRKNGRKSLPEPEINLESPSIDEMLDEYDSNLIIEQYQGSIIPALNISRDQKVANSRAQSQEPRLQGTPMIKTPNEMEDIQIRDDDGNRERSDSQHDSARSEQSVVFKTNYGGVFAAIKQSQSPVNTEEK